jgi:hypothetical protein
MTTHKASADDSHGVTSQAHGAPLRADDLEGLVQKLKLLEFGRYGLQEYGRSAPLDVEDIGPFCRLAEEIESDVLALQQRMNPRAREDAL